MQLRSHSYLSMPHILDPGLRMNSIRITAEQED